MYETPYNVELTEHEQRNFYFENKNRVERNFYFRTLYKCRDEYYAEDFTKMLDDTGNKIRNFDDWLVNRYGVKILYDDDDDGRILSEYEIVNEQKHLIFLLKFT